MLKNFPAATYSSLSSAPDVTAFGPIHSKLSARKLASVIPRSEDRMALARVKRASGSFVMGGGVDGGRGAMEVPPALSKGFGRLSRNDSIFKAVPVMEGASEILVRGGAMFEGTNATELATSSAAASVCDGNFMIYINNESFFVRPVCTVL
jgi:hypothetical protein